VAATLVTATDELIRAFLIGWDRAPAAVALPGAPPKFEWIDNLKDPDGVPNKPTKAPWARIKSIHATGRGTSVTDRRYENGGTLFIQIFVPKMTTDAGDVAQKIAQVVNEGLKEYRGSVTLSSIRHNDVPSDGAYFRQEVLCQFTWTEVRSLRYGR
jgi:hypothetical protein